MSRMRLTRVPALIVGALLALAALLGTAAPASAAVVPSTTACSTWSEVPHTAVYVRTCLQAVAASRNIPAYTYNTVNVRNLGAADRRVDVHLKTLEAEGPQISRTVSFTVRRGATSNGYLPWQIRGRDAYFAQNAVAVAMPRIVVGPTVTVRVIGG